MFKQEIICPSCAEHYIVVFKEIQHSSFCPLCGETVLDEDERGDLEMGSDDDE